MAKQFELTKRILAVRKSVGLTQRVFADKLGVSPGYLAQVETNRGKPSIEMVLGIAEQFPVISRDWLLTGEGLMSREYEYDKEGHVRPQVVIGEGDRMSPPRPLIEDAIERQANELVRQLGLRSLAMLTRYGRRAGVFHVLLALQEHYPEPCDIKTLQITLDRHHLSLEQDGILACLLLAEKEGFVAELPDQAEKFKLIRHMVEMASHDISDVNEHAREAMRELKGAILPALESPTHHGVLVTSRIKTEEGAGWPLIQEVLREVHSRWQAKDSEDGSEVLHLVLGMAVDDYGEELYTVTSPETTIPGLGEKG